MYLRRSRRSPQISARWLPAAVVAGALAAELARLIVAVLQ